MRRALRCLCAAAAFAAALGCALFARALLSSPVFRGGESYELYYEKNSSGEIVVCTSPAPVKFLRGRAAGESVRYQGDVSERLMEEFHAEVVFCESAGGVVNYYCRSPELGAGVRLNEGTVNLHIAVGHGETAAGTPLIFGGF